jgi:hypothetical protein
MQIINFYLSALDNLLDVDTTGIRNGAVLGWNTTTTKWNPMYATTTTTAA